MTGSAPTNRGDELRVPIYNAMRELVAQQNVKAMHFITVYILGPEEEGNPETFHLVSSLPMETVTPVLLQMVHGITSQQGALTQLEMPNEQNN